MSTECNEEKKRQVQRLALRGYDFDCSCHLVLEVEDASHARKFLGSVLREQGLVTFGERERDGKVGGEDGSRARREYRIYVSGPSGAGRAGSLSERTAGQSPCVL